MANEASKTKKLWGEFEWSLMRGEGIDIGCGPDPILPQVEKFDLDDGDANRISAHINRQFDFVFSSHCLEHMSDAKAAINEWWKLVKPGGVLFILVPDEDLYEQGFWPSRFNSDHKWTFTIAKQDSWSPVSINLLSLARSLPDSELLDIRLQDIGYQRHLLSNGLRVGSLAYRAKRFATRKLNKLIRITGLKRQLPFHPIDQTTRENILAQIQCVVRKQTR